MKKAVVVAVFLGLCGPLCRTVPAVSMNFTGNFRSEGEFLNKPDLGLVPNSPNKAFMTARALVNPNLVIDDHFSIKSQWMLLTSPGYTPSVQALGIGQGGYVFGDVNSTSFFVTRAWLEWTSDFGVLRLGRMPLGWGYGLLYDDGSQVWDDFQTTFDRLEYRLHLGHVVGALGLSKPRKLSVQGDQNDSTFYTIYLQYDNPELDVNAGILYEYQWRSPSQAAAFSNPTAAGTGYVSPYYVPPGSPVYPLAQKTPYPETDHVIDVYVKKTTGYFTFGGELTWVTGNAFSYTGDGNPDTVNATGFLLNATYEYHKLKIFADAVYASGDSNLNSDHMNGFVLLNRNRRPGLILGRELLGPYAGNNVHLGACEAYGNQGSFSGCMYLRPGFSIEWAQSWSSGAEIIVARKAVTQSGEAASLGVELDLGTNYAIYQNFDVGANFGYLFAGNGLGVPNPSGVVALRATAALKF